MKRFSTLLILAFSRKGFMAFTVYYMLFFMSILQVFPSSWMQGLAMLVGPYYAAIRIIGLMVGLLALLMIFRLVVKYLQYEPYPIKRRTLSFILAVCLIQLISFFCYSNLPITHISVTAQLQEMQKTFLMYHLYIVELIGLCLNGYLLAFYVGALSRSGFAMDVVLAPKKPQK